MVAAANHDGDLDALAATIEDGSGSFLSGTVEAKLSHLDDLRLRLTEAGIDAAVGTRARAPAPTGRARVRRKKVRSTTDHVCRWHRAGHRRQEGGTSKFEVRESLMSHQRSIIRYNIRRKEQ